MIEFVHQIYRWYETNARELPWRKTKNPYKIWLSEIILQQTRVAQGTSYYNRFAERFPTVEKLAKAHEDEILKLWQGLGYYSRARNLHLSAKFIVNNYNGVFPSQHKHIINLKGIGPYTAAAIASIAFNLPYPTVDGNIYRVLSRYFGIFTPTDTEKGKKEFYKLAEELLSREKAGYHNQALMEFGALQCIPKSPKCQNCPINQFCYAYKNSKIEALPVKSKKTKQTKRYFYYYYLDMGEDTFLQKRVKNDIWKNLYQFPLIESKHALNETELVRKKLPFSRGDKINIKTISNVKKHVLSHQIIYARLIHVELSTYINNSEDFIRVNKKDISKFAVPRLLEQFFEALQIN